MVFGWFIDRVGIKLGYAISIVCWSLAALSHGFVGSVRGFFLARVALGAGEGGNFPACIKASACWFPQRERAFAASFFNSGTNVAAVIAPAIVPWIALHYGWQMCFVAAGTAGFLWLALWLPLYHNHPATAALSPRPSVISLKATISRTPSNLRSAGCISSPTARHGRSCSAKFLTDPVWWFFLDLAA